jgi:hypothetical protein
VAASRNLVPHKPKALVAAKAAAQPVASLVVRPAVKAVAASRNLVAHKTKARVAAKVAQPAARAKPSKPLMA